MDLLCFLKLPVEAQRDAEIPLRNKESWVFCAPRPFVVLDNSSAHALRLVVSSKLCQQKRQHIRKLEYAAMSISVSLPRVVEKLLTSLLRLLILSLFVQYPNQTLKKRIHDIQLFAEAFPCYF